MTEARVKKPSGSRRVVTHVRARTKYDPAHCDTLVDLATKGHSPIGFCGHILITISTFYAWLDEYPDFREAHEIAKSVRVYFAENLLIQADAPLTVAKAQIMLKAFGKQVWDPQNYKRYEDPMKMEIFDPEPLV